MWLQLVTSLPAQSHAVFLMRGGYAIHQAYVGDLYSNIIKSPTPAVRYAHDVKRVGKYFGTWVAPP